MSMKKIKTIAVFSLFALLLVVSCSLPQNSSEAEQGTLRLTIAGTGERVRTLFPSTDGISYDVTFTSGGTTINKTMTTGTDSFSLEEGTWDITVTAKKETTALARGGQNGVTVSASSPGPEVTITLQPITDGGAAQGTFQWSVDYPDGVTVASLYISKADGSPVSDYDPFDITGVTATEGVRSGNVNLDPGTYLLRVRLTNGATNFSAGKAEAFHIYSGQSTSAVYAFLPGEFSDTKTLGGSAEVTHSAGVDVTTVSIDIYGTSGAVDFLDTVTLTPSQTGNEWTYTTMVPDSYATVYVVEKIIANGEVLSIPEQTVTVAASGADLTGVTVYGISVEKTGTGTVTVNGEEVESTAALSGDTITLEATPGSDWVLGSLKVGTDDYTAPFAISGDISVSVVFKFPITGISIKRAGTTVSGSSITIEVNQEYTLTAVLAPTGVTGTVTWESSDAAVTVTPATGESGTVKGITEDSSATITARAINDDTQTEVTATVTVGVTTEPWVDPNLIWQWSYAVNGGPTGSISGSTGKLTGTGQYTQVSIRSKGGSGYSVTNEASLGGIQIDTTGSAWGALLIGTNDNTNSNATSSPDGEFDFRTNNTNGIKVTLGCEILTDATGSGRSLSVYLNNSNASSASNTPLSAGNNEARIVFFQTPTKTGTIDNPASNGYWDLAAKTLTSKTFKPDDLNPAYISTLEKAFISIAGLATSGTNTGGKFLITSIKIEYAAE
jgi:hypothetical protein